MPTMVKACNLFVGSAGDFAYGTFLRVLLLDFGVDSDFLLVFFEVIIVEMFTSFNSIV